MLMPLLSRLIFRYATIAATILMPDFRRRRFFADASLLLRFIRRRFFFFFLLLNVPAYRYAADCCFAMLIFLRYAVFATTLYFDYDDISLHDATKNTLLICCLKAFADADVSLSITATSALCCFHFSY